MIPNNNNSIIQNERTISNEFPNELQTLLVTPTLGVKDRVGMLHHVSCNPLTLWVTG